MNVAEWQTAEVLDLRGDGRGWRLAHRDHPHEPVWTVSLVDAGPFPVFQATSGERSSAGAPLEEMTVGAVADLLATAGMPDAIGWFTRNIASGLLLAAQNIVGWEGEEWSIEGDGENATLWAAPEDERTPFNWLRCSATAGSTGISTYQDDEGFGLRFESADSGFDQTLQDAEGLLRPRTRIPLVVGAVDRVHLAFDTTVQASGRGLLTEALIEVGSTATLLIAAEADDRETWYLYDESVVALTDPSAANRLTWNPARTPWDWDAV